MLADSHLRKLLWIDCSAGALVGLVVVSTSAWLSPLEGLPRDILLFTGVVNLACACYSFSLARRSSRPVWSIRLLAAANLAWVPVCLGLAVYFGEQASLFGLTHLIGEALFVGGLGLLEWRHRFQLATH